MLEWYVVAGIVGIRGLCNGGLTMFVVESSGTSSRYTIGAAGLTVMSAVLTAAVLLGVLGPNASYLGFLVQVALLVLAGYVVYTNPTAGMSKPVVAVSLFGIALLIATIPLYGDPVVTH